ncbi:MAG: acetyl-CoA hydrolase/transferase C-terminal domain-containing protein, partial [Syntrophomonadaceae bacterium]|nr:acetyl-CoA hydrolase/transferase C-terminal domain-containing protein [Syntrophomonadaceae bacterium]
MSWMEEYRKKLVTADEAVKVVKSGDWVEYAFGVCSANELDAALSRRKDELLDVKIRCDIGSYPHYTLDVDPTHEHFCWNSWHVAGYDRKHINNGLYYIPMKFHECPVMTRNDCDPTNVFMATVSPMDKHGYFSFGAGCPSAWAAVEKSQYVILEVNTNMPRVLGGNQESIHISQVDYVFESSNFEMPILPDVAPNETEQQIAEHIIKRLYDGCCIQLGIGGIPNAMGAMIAESDLKDLGVHTEMYVDAYVKMSKAGKVTGAKKNLDKYKQVFSFAMGSKELYDFIDDNPSTIAYSVDYTNNPHIVAQLDNFVSINACIEVDLFGQVCAESVGTRHISGTGGQLDFVEGAYKSKGGQSFVCMTSTFNSKNGVVSRIKPILTPGAIVTDPRTATHMIVTEYGIANMKGKSTWERAEALIAIAHPDFRDEL